MVTTGSSGGGACTCYRICFGARLFEFADFDFSRSYERGILGIGMWSLPNTGNAFTNATIWLLWP